MATGTRNIVVAFRITPSEAAHLDAAGQSLSKPRLRADYARAAALHAAKARVPEPPKTIRRPGRRRPAYDIELLAKILGQLGKVGSNVNQIAKAANGGGQGPTSRMLSRLIIDLVEIRDAVRTALDGSQRDDDRGDGDGHQG